MKFNISLPDDVKLILEKQYKDFIKNNTMTKEERKAVLKWVKDGNSVYDNGSGVYSMDFLTVYREEEYIRNRTKGMSPEETHRFAMNFYGWSEDDNPSSENTFFNLDIAELDEDHPFV